MDEEKKHLIEYIKYTLGGQDLHQILKSILNLILRSMIQQQEENQMKRKCDI